MSWVEAILPALVCAALVLGGLLLWWLPFGHRAAAAQRRQAGNSADGAAAREHDGPPLPVSAGVLVELVAAMLEAGVPVSHALTVLAPSVRGPSGDSLRIVGTALRLGLSWRQAWAAAGEVPRPVEDLRAALTFSAVSGAPSASALRAASAQVRRAEHRRAEAGAERLSVQLMVPLGLCSLPAFLCWGIVPVLIGLVPDLLG